MRAKTEVFIGVEIFFPTNMLPNRLKNSMFGVSLSFATVFSLGSIGFSFKMIRTCQPNLAFALKNIHIFKHFRVLYFLIKNCQSKYGLSGLINAKNCGRKPNNFNHRN